MVLSYQGTKIYYSSTGAGNPLVLLHGFLESGKIWEDLSAEFSKQRQIICIDFPGHGSSGTIGDIHTMELLAEIVLAVLQELRVEKADFLGHSMGGYVSLAFLEKYPEKVQKIVLVNSTPAPDTEERKTNRDRSVNVINKNKHAFISMAISNLLSRENNLKFQKEVNSLKEEAYNFPTKGLTNSLKGMKNRTDRTSVLKDFSGDKYIVAGKQDPILNHEEIRKLSKTCQTTFVSLADGHLSYIENKEEFFKFVYFIE